MTLNGKKEAHSLQEEIEKSEFDFLQPLSPEGRLRLFFEFRKTFFLVSGRELFLQGKERHSNDDDSQSEPGCDKKGSQFLREKAVNEVVNCGAPDFRN